MKLPKLSIVAGLIVLAFVLLSLTAPWIAGDPGTNTNAVFPLVKFGPETTDIFNSKLLGAPDDVHYLGTDYIGRDVLARLVHAVKNALFFSVAVVIICMFIGTIIGGIMGFFGGTIDLVLSRIMEVIGNFPIFLLQLTLLAFFDASYGVLLFVMTLPGWIPYCRFTRAEFLRLRNQDFVQASIAMGAGRTRLFFKHLLPNSLTPVLIYIPFDLSSTIIILGAFSFIGFGEPINVASLGELLKQAKDHFQHAWWLAVFPGLTLFVLTLSLALFGSSLRDWLDPRNVKN